MSYTPIFATQPPLASFGQLGGPWGWYALWSRSIGHGYAFDEWMWTDEGTAQLVARVQRRQAPMADYEVLPGSGWSRYEWHGITKDGGHLSWVYTNPRGVNLLNGLLSPQGLALCHTGLCKDVRKPSGEVIA